MPLNTDFNIRPYFDDFDESKNFHRILFKPSMAVQARELTQLQTMLQTQIERFGDNILREGTIVTGGNFVEERNISYVRLQDLDSNDLNRIKISNYVGKIAVGTVSGLRAQIIEVKSGLESQFPDTNTIWVKYLNTTQNTTTSTDQKVFLNGEDIDIYEADGITEYETAVALITDATGKGYGVRCGDGVIYQKGFFTRFENQLAIVSKYDNAPDGVVVGFVTQEVIVNSFQDESLLDNANSFNNFNAPGADRLKLIPVLTTKTLAEAELDETFFALQEYQGGRVVRRKLDTVYSVIGDVMAQRRYEESGNYVVRGFDIGAEESANADNITLTVSSGVGYISGYRVELADTFKIDVPQGIDTETEFNQNVLINYGNYVIVDNMTGFFDFEQIDSVTLQDSTNANIGTARVRSVTTHDSVAQTYRIYLFDIKMNTNQSFANVKKILNGTDGSATTVLNTNSFASLTDGSFNSLVFPVGRSHIKTFFPTSVPQSLTEYVYRTKLIDQMSLGGTIQLSLTGADEFPYGYGATLSIDQKEDFIIVVTNDNGDPTYPTGTVLDVNDCTIGTDGTGKIATITFNVNPTAVIDVLVYCNVMKTNVRSIGKIPQTFTVTHNITTNTNGPWSLGVPDAYKIDSVTINGVDATSSFKLNTGQRDSFYGYSYLVKNGASIATGDVVVVEFKAFTKSTTGLYTQSFFNVDSYISIPTIDIPVYISESGTKINLRDAIDFRPYVDRAPQFAGGLTATNPTTVETYPTAALFMAAPNSYVNATFEYYLGRFDKLIMDQNAKLNVIQGQSAVNPIRPVDPSDGIVLGTYYIPPYPSLPSITANKLSLPNYAVRYNKQNNKRYTMADIRSLDLRIQNIEYYTSLSLLENKTKDLIVLDGNGLNRFKNGIFVEPFKDFRIGDIYNPEFSAALNQFDTVIEPKHKIIPIDLKVVSTSNATNFGDIVTLNKKDYVTISQPYATAVKNCTTGLYNYRGDLQLMPDDDTVPDVIKAPDINIDIDLTTPFIEYTDFMWDFVFPNAPPTTAANLFTTTTTNATRRGNTNVIAATTSNLSIDNFVNTVEVGDYVKDITIDPYIRAKEVKVYCVGLRPNTRVWAYFDQKDVSTHCSPAKFSRPAAIPLPNDNPNVIHANQILAEYISATGSKGDALYTNADGTFAAVFFIPEETFKVGERLFEIFDVSSYNSSDALTTYASKTYNAFNFSLTKSSLTVSTKIPDFNITRTVNVTEEVPEDPIIQSFIIDPNAADEAYTFITKVDLFFNTKSSTNGVTVSLREFENGNPTGVTLPYSRVHLTPTAVNISEKGTTVTSVVFNAPIPLKTNSEYGIVVQPDGGNPDYRVFISRTGEKDVLSNLSITHDTNSGMVFTSTNNRTFIPYQNENLKFNLYAAEFTTAQGSVTLEPKAHEFLALQNKVGTFLTGEKVFVEYPNNAGTLTFTAGDNIVLGDTTTFTTDLVSGDWIAADVGTHYEMLKVTTNGVDNNTKLRLANFPTTSNTNVSWFKTVIGTISAIIVNDDDYKLVLKDSSAKIGLVFADGAKLIGATSGATADILSVQNQKISSLQPNIRQLNFIDTRTVMFGSMNNGVSSDRYHMPFNNVRNFNETEYYIPSASNVLTGSPPSRFEIELRNVSTRTPLLASPFVEHSVSSMFAYEYLVNNDTTNETTTSGNAKSKYVSKLATLADGMDAVDFKVYMSAYRPVLTDVKVYIKCISLSDGRNHYDVGWTEMKLKAETDYFSAATDLYDFREFEYGLPTVDPGTGVYDSVWYNGTDFSYRDPSGVTYNNFKYYSFKVVLLSDTYSRAPKVDDIRGVALT